jgi:two-component system, NarL family, sensor kinase
MEQQDVLTTPGRPGRVRWRAAPSAPPSTGRLLVRFAAASFAALAVVAMVTAVVSRQLGEQEGIAQAADVVTLAAKGVVEPALTPAVIDGNPAALARFDQLVRRSVVRGSLVRMKLWTTDGMVFYSDDGRLVGERFPLDDEALEALANDEVHIGISDLNKPENRFEDSSTELLEAYLPIRAGDQTVLFEAYFRMDGVNDAGRQVWLAFAPVTIGALFLLTVVQLPFASSLAKRLQRQHREREHLLRAAIDTAELERRRIASDLHDGVVQDLTGVSLALAARARRSDTPDPVIESAADAVRESVRAMRTLLVEIYPPDLEREGLGAALTDLAARLDARGTKVDLDVAFDDRMLPVDRAALVYRTAQESLRNVEKHAMATSVTVRVRRDGPDVVLDVDDDGRGFDPAAVDLSVADGHVGLRVMHDLATEAGGVLDVTSAPGAGTCVRLRLPAPEER